MMNAVREVKDLWTKWLLKLKRYADCIVVTAYLNVMFCKIL